MKTTRDLLLLSAAVLALLAIACTKNELLAPTTGPDSTGNTFSDPYAPITAVTIGNTVDDGNGTGPIIIPDPKPDPGAITFSFDDEDDQ